jgi:AI-2 transport protein TqsA
VLALIQFGRVQAVQVIVAYCVINVLIDYVLRPRIMGKDLNMSQIVAFLAVIVWGALLGPTGALLCIPLTLIAKLVLEMATRTTRYSALVVEELPAVIDIAVPAAVETSGGAAPVEAGSGVAPVETNGDMTPFQIDREATAVDAPTTTKR